MPIPTVSICVPTYKQTVYLRKLLQSIKVQKFTDYELIITDDTPGDSIRSLVEEFNFQKKLRYYKNSQQLGAPGNWNYSISLAQGKYIKIMHHDDYFASELSLGKFVELLDTDPDRKIAFSATFVDDASGSSWTHCTPSEILQQIQVKPSVLYFGNVVGSPSVTIYRKSDNYKFDANLRWLVDLDFYIRLFRDSPSIGFTSEPLIWTACGAAHQVTRSCENNKNLELFEYSYLLDRLHPFSSGMLKRFFVFWMQMCRRYHVTSTQEIQDFTQRSLETKLLIIAAIYRVKLSNLLSRNGSGM